MTNPNVLKETDFFRIPKFELSLFGWWTGQKKGFPFYFYINYVSLFGSSVVTTMYGILHIDNIPLAFDAFCPSFTEAVSFIKMTVALYYRHEFKAFLNKLHVLYTNGKRMIKVTIE